MYLLIGLEDVTTEGAVWKLSSDVTEDFHIL